MIKWHNNCTEVNEFTIRVYKTTLGWCMECPQIPDSPILLSEAVNVGDARVYALHLVKGFLRDRIEADSEILWKIDNGV